MTVNTYLIVVNRREDEIGYSKHKHNVLYSEASGGFRIVIKTQFARIVSMTIVLKNGCVKVRMARRRKPLKGENRKQALVELNRKMVLLLLITTKPYESGDGCLFKYRLK